MAAKVLVLAGTTEASALARLLDEHGHDVISSLAGVTSAPSPRPGRVRTGGFGGTDGLAAYLRAEGIGAVIDATHPFAAVMPFHAVDACASVGVPHCRLVRPPWTRMDGDRWIDVPSMAAAAASLAGIGARRVFLAVGRQSLDPFAGCEDQWFLTRSIEPVTVELTQFESIRSRGPFTVESERTLLREHQIDAVVTKNAGGDATSAKLTAARELGLPVVMVARPPSPAGMTEVATAVAAREWLDGLA